MIRFQQVSKAYRGGRQALQKVDFHLRPADMAFLTGHSGAGKSTLLRMLAGLMKPDAGVVEFDGKPLKNPEEQLIAGHDKIKMVFQDCALMPQICPFGPSDISN